SGYLIQRLDRRGQITRQYTYTAGGNLDTIEDYPGILTGSQRRVYQFGDGLFVTDHATATTTTGKQTEYYGGTFSSTAITDPNGTAYSIGYNSLGQVSSLHQRGGMKIVYNSIPLSVIPATE